MAAVPKGNVMDATAFAHWHSNHPFAMPPEDECEMAVRVKPKIISLPRFPRKLRELIFSFLRIYPAGMLFDLKCIVLLLDTDTDDGLQAYDQPAEIVQRLQTILAVLDEHTKLLELFSSYRWAFGLPADQPHNQQGVVEDVLALAYKRHELVLRKWEPLSRWVAFYTQLLETRVCEMKRSDRAKVTAFKSESAELARVYCDDRSMIRFQADVEAVDNKIDDVAGLGNPNLTPNDYRSIFYRIGLNYPGGEDYPQSLTYCQAVALSLYLGNPIYLWEDRKCYAGKEEELTEEEIRAQQEKVDEAANKSRRQAATLAADLMDTGCDMCGTHNIHWVGVNKRTAAMTPPNIEGIAVCTECLPAFRDDARPVYNMYEWYFIEELVRAETKVNSTVEANGATWELPYPGPVTTLVDKLRFKETFA